MAGCGALAATRLHVDACWDALAAHFDGTLPPPPSYEEVVCPFFVTWTRDADERLRGCIGSLEAQPLRAGLPATALTSALRDRRFAPVSRDELPRLRCTVSLLHQYEALAAGPGAWQDWTVGVHGLTLRFSDPSPAAPARRYCATYLPEVAKAEGWSRRTAVESLVRKAGFSGPVDSRLLAALQVTRYQSSRCACTYDQWAAGGGGLPN